MPRPNKIWFRKDTRWWMVTIAGKKTRLAKGRNNKELAQQKFHELMITRHQCPDGPSARVADLIEAFLAFAEKRCAPDTYRVYRDYGQRFAEACGQQSAGELKPFHVTQWVDRHPWNETTQRNAQRVAHRVMSWAKEQGLISANPLAGMKCPPAKTRQRALTEEEIRTIIGASHGRLRILLWALCQTGARHSELRRLTWQDVHTNRFVLQHHKTERKTHKPRVIHLTPPMQRLVAYLRKRSTSKYVFVNTRGLPWTTNAIRLALSRIKKKHGLSADVCAYLFRHSFGTYAIMNGLSSSEVAELMGHASTQTTDRIYVHLADQVHHLQDAVCRATRPLPKPDAGGRNRGVKKKNR